MRGAVVLSSVILVAAVSGYGQNSTSPTQATPSISEQTSLPSQPVTQKESKSHKHSKSAGAEVGSGVGDIGKGTAKGAGDLAKGTGKGVVDLATLHPLNAAGDIGKGAGEAGGHIAVGTVKGTGKVVKGTAKAIKKVF
jgi:hypothetical protein